MSTLNRASGPYDRHAEIARIDAEWSENPRWQQVTRTHSAEDVVRLRGSMNRDNMLARRGAEKLWDIVNRNARTVPTTNLFIHALEGMSGGEAVNHVKAGTQVITLSGGQIAAVRQINSAFARADQIQWKAGAQAESRDYFAPLIADGEASFCGVLSGYELAQNLIRAGAAGVHFADQLADETDEPVLVSTQDAVQKLIAARLAADVEDVPTLIFARTNADSIDLLMTECDACDQPFVVGERNDEGFYPVKGGVELAIARGLAYAPYADVVWCETTEPNLDEAKQFAEAIRREYPDQLLAYSCSPSASHMGYLDDSATATFQRELAALGYTFQFIASEQHREQPAIGSRAA